MEADTWNWSNYSEESNPAFNHEDLTPVTGDPIAELACEMVLAMMAIETFTGGWCDDCTCQLGYHITTDSGECEVCGCYDQHKKPEPMYIPSPVYAPRKKTGPRNLSADSTHYGAVYSRERNLAAREALKELTE